MDSRISGESIALIRVPAQNLTESLTLRMRVNRKTFAKPDPTAGPGAKAPQSGDRQVFDDLFVCSSLSLKGAPSQ